MPETGDSSHEDCTMHRVGLTTTSRTRAAVAREALVNLIVKNGKWEPLNWAKKMRKTDAYQRLRNVALKVNMPELRYGTALEIRDSTNTSVGVTFEFLDEQMYDAKRLERLGEEMTEYTVEKFEGRGKRKSSCTDSYGGPSGPIWTSRARSS